MFYEFAVTVPKNTAASSPILAHAYLDPGVVTRVSVQFPHGCFGLVHAAVRRGVHQVWPSNPDGSITANNESVTWDEQHPLDEEPYRLTLVAWSDDDTFSHTVTFRFAVLPAARADEQRAALNALLYLDRWFRGAGAAIQGGA